MNLRPGKLLYAYLQLMQYSIHRAMMRYKLKQISTQIKGRWLDIGAGDQPYKKYFAGADEYLTTNTKRHYLPEDLEEIEKLTTYWIEDGKQLPLPDNSLDGVACFQVLSVIDKPEDFFMEIGRILKPGGKLILTTDFLYPVWSKEDRYRHTAFNLRQLSESNGFIVETVESFGGFGSAIHELQMRFMRSFPDIWKQKTTLSKVVSAIPYLILLVILPILNLSGRLIFQIEKRCTWNTDFTFNLILKALKKPS